MTMLAGKVAIVTGAGRGLGQAYAEALAEQGAAVVVSDVIGCAETLRLVETAGAKGISVDCDVSDAGACRFMADRAMESFDRIDVLINNAALYGALKGGRMEAITEQDWDRCMAVNVKGIWNATKACVPHMRVGGGGSVINISSLAATYGLPFALHYTTSKGAVIGMTRGMARELGRDNIRVNAIAPSAVLTEGTDEFFGDKKERALQVVAQGQALQRNLTTDDLIGTVLYLASDASTMVTGQTLAVDGGTVLL